MGPSEKIDMTPSEKGERAEIAVIAALAEAGLRVLVPFGGYHRFDLAFEHCDRIVKVQCKSGRLYKGAIAFSTSDHTVGVSRDYRGDADLFGVYCHERREVISYRCRTSPFGERIYA